MRPSDDPGALQALCETLRNHSQHIITEVTMNPVFYIVIVIVILCIIANRRGWGYIPFLLFAGCLAVLLVVGGLTGLAIIPDGVVCLRCWKDRLSVYVPCFWTVS